MSECAYLAFHQSSGNACGLAHESQPNSRVLKRGLPCSRIQQAYCSGLCMHLPATMRSRWTDKLLQTKQLMQGRAIYTGRMPGTICTTRRYAHSSSMLACSCYGNAAHLHHCFLGSMPSPPLPPVPTPYQPSHPPTPPPPHTHPVAQLQHGCTA